MTTTILNSPITTSMKQSYLDYAMSVIVARALPDVRDGLKPVQRRILYTMFRLGLTAGAKTRKSATVVGEVLGKYHPHGDVPVYEALVRMAQTFSMRYPLVRGQGNFGSIDGDPPAAMRYTEAKLEKIAEEIMIDYDKETVLWRDNFDSTLKEPEYLPGAVPNLLLNGAEGIAVGMATKIPTHNLGELIDGVLATIDTAVFDKKLPIEEALSSVTFSTTIDDLLEHVKGPDFPTGGILYSQSDIREAYETGRKSLVVRGVASIEENKKGREAVIITELPYQVNKASLVARIAELVTEKKLVGISGLRDESDRRGIRVVVEIKKDAVAKKVLNNLYLKTSLQTTFPVNMVALVDGIPQTLSLKSILDLFLRHRADILIKKTKYELKIAKAREHILEGLIIAIDNIDEIVDIIKKSESEAVAKTNLIARFKFSEIQAQAILDMQLKRLTGLEKEKLQAELEAIRAEIERLMKILSSLANVFAEVKKSLLRIKESYADKRRTKIIKNRPGEFSDEQLIENKDMYVILTRDGYIKSLPKTTFTAQNRGGKGVMGITTNDGDMVSKVIACQTHDHILLFSNRGKVYQIRVWDIPEASRQAKGKAVVNLIPISSEEKVTAMYTYDPGDTASVKGLYVFFATKQGYVKKTALSEYLNIRASGLIAIKLEEGDELIGVGFIKPKWYIFLVSVSGKAILFPEENVREMGRSARGVRGIRMKEKDEFITTLSVVPAEQIKTCRMIIVTQRGLGKGVKVSEFRMQGRGGVGVKAANITPKSGPITFADLIDEKNPIELLLTSAQGQVVQIKSTAVPTLSRTAQGVIIMRFSEQGDYIASATIVEKEHEA